MFPDNRVINTGDWVTRATDDPVVHRQRQAIEVVLHSIATQAPRYRLYLKGGLLMGLVHESPRLSSDIDLTAGFAAERGIGERFAEALRCTNPAASAALGRAELVVDIHNIREMPRGLFEAGRFPALQIKIVHATRSRSGKPQPMYFDVDVSFNEPVRAIRTLRIAGDRELYAYDLAELVVEKYRAILQQIPRRRNRRQDIFDLHYLTVRNSVDESALLRIFEIFRQKCRRRDIEQEKASLFDPEIIRRSGADWQGIALETGSLPVFEQCFSQVQAFYESLPWPDP